MIDTICYIFELTQLSVYYNSIEMKGLQIYWGNTNIDMKNNSPNCFYKKLIYNQTYFK